MKRLNRQAKDTVRRPIRVLQYGEGNFLRAFCDWMLDIANEKTDFNGAVCVVKPAPFGSLAAFEEQDNLYTVILRGLKNGEKFEESRVVTSVQQAVDPFQNYAAYADMAKCDTLQFVISNTTEAGIALDESDEFALCPPRSFPGKVCKLLYERAEHFDYAEDKGLIFLPVELIDDNGVYLKKYVKALAERWDLGDRFLRWLDDACVFASTLVDRIVTGYPKDEAESLWQKLGYEDRLLVTAEPFGLWVIECGKDLRSVLPLPQCGLPVIYTDNQKPYKQRKVRILNGAHTSFVPMAFLLGYDDVLSAMRDEGVARFMRETVRQEVIPTLTLPKDDLTAFADAVSERFCNPFIRHLLLSICLNSVSKWRARCLPSLMQYVQNEGRLPRRLAFSLTALMALYHGGELKDGKLFCVRGGESYVLQDEEAVLRFFAEHSGESAQALTHAFLSDARFFGQDLTAVEGLEAFVAQALDAVLKQGMRAAFQAYFGA